MVIDRFLVKRLHEKNDAQAKRGIFQLLAEKKDYDRTECAQDIVQKSQCNRQSKKTRPESR